MTKEYQREWYAKQVATRPDFRNKQALSERIRHRNDPRKTLLRNARTRAKQFNLPIDLSLEDIVIPEFCPILKFELSKERKIGGCFNTPSLDRIVPELGYVRGNIWVISMRANAMKNQATKEDLRNFSTWINQFTN